jgi:hypothetical protein
VLLDCPHVYRFDEDGEIIEHGAALPIVNEEGEDDDETVFNFPVDYDFMGNLEAYGEVEEEDAWDQIHEDIPDQDIANHDILDQDIPDQDNEDPDQDIANHDILDQNIPDQDNEDSPEVDSPEEDIEEEDTSEEEDEEEITEEILSADTEYNNLVSSICEDIEKLHSIECGPSTSGTQKRKKWEVVNITDSDDEAEEEDKHIIKKKAKK